jgi:hypothetical protein
MATKFTGRDNQIFEDIDADSGDFTLRGGQYGVTVNATFGGGSVTLQKKSADDTTYVTCLTAFTADGYATVNLPPGTYNVALATATAAYVSIESVVTA